MDPIELIMKSADPAATLKAMLAGKEGDALKKSVKALADAGLKPDLLVPYSEDSIESLLSLAEQAQERAADDVIAQLDTALEKASRTAQEATALVAAPLAMNAEFVDAVAAEVYEKIGGDDLKKSLKSIEAGLDRQVRILEKSGRVIAMTLGEDLKKSGRAQAITPAERSTTAAGGAPGAKKLNKGEAKAAFKRSLRLAHAANDQAALETLSAGATLLDALDPRDAGAVERVNAALRFAVTYKS